MDNKRKEIYLKWKEAYEAKQFAKSEKERLTKIGDMIFQEKYHGSFEKYDDINGDPELDNPWFEADLQDEKITSNELLMEDYYKQLLELTSKDFLDEYASYARIGHSFQKLVKIIFLTGQKKLAIFILGKATIFAHHIISMVNI